MIPNQIPKAKAKNEIEKNLYILKLERCNQDLLKLRQKLGSYICEPTTLGLFERMELLRNQLESMRDNNVELCRRLREDSILVYTAIDSIDLTFKDFAELSKNIEDYVSRARPC